jgi:hypothetical protein
MKDTIYIKKRKQTICILSYLTLLAGKSQINQNYEINVLQTVEFII